MMFTRLECYEFKMTYNLGNVHKWGATKFNVVGKISVQMIIKSKKQKNMWSVMCGSLKGGGFPKTGIGPPPPHPLENFSGSGHDGTAIKFSQEMVLTLCSK